MTFDLFSSESHHASRCRHCPAGFCGFVTLYVPGPLLPTLAGEFHTSVPAISLLLTASTLGVALAAAFAGMTSPASWGNRMLMHLQKTARSSRVPHGIQRPLVLGAESTASVNRPLWLAPNRGRKRAKAYSLPQFPHAILEFPGDTSLATFSPIGGANPKRVLVVEDNPADVHLLEEALQHHQIPYELSRYSDGEKAVRALVRDDCAVPDLILIDLNLPRREGFDVLRAVRNNPTLVGVPVGIFTSSAAAQDRHRAELLQPDQYIYKPMTYPEFIDKVGSAIVRMLAKV